MPFFSNAAFNSFIASSEFDIAVLDKICAPRLISSMRRTNRSGNTLDKTAISRLKSDYKLKRIQYVDPRERENHII